MTSSRTKITLSRWEDNRPTSRSLSYLDLYDVDTGIESINKKLRETRFIEPIVYNKQNDKLREATELLNETVKYISGVIDDVDELIDEPFFQAYNKADGVLEDLKRIVLDDYKVKNTLGITEEVIDYANSSSKADLATKEIVKETIGLKDLLHNQDISGVGELQSFSELFKEQYETLSEANEDLANMSYGEYVESLIGRGNIQHTVDKGWLNVLGDALDIIGITSLIGCFTGTNVFTGQILTSGERKSAAFTAIINIGSLALAISTAGAGSLLALGLKGATKVVATTTFKWCMVNMISGMSGLLVGGVLDMLGAPTWLKIAGTLGGAALGRSIANKTLFKTAVKGTIEDIANKTGLQENQIQDIMNYKKMTAEELALALQGGASIESLLGVPDMNMKYLMEQTGMSAEEISKLLDAKNQNINSINGSNIDSTVQMLKGANGSLDETLKSYKDLTPDEQSIVNKLLSKGHDVKLMPETPNVGKTYDLLVDGIATELKTLNSSNINTLVTKVGRALDQLDGNGNIIYDISKANFTPSQMEEIMSRLIGKYGEDIVNKIIFIK